MRTGSSDSTGGLISSGEKQVIRSALLEFFRQGHRSTHLNDHVASIIMLICKSDFPTVWGSVLDDLTAICKDQSLSVVSVYFAAKTVKGIVKQASPSSGRMAIFRTGKDLASAFVPIWLRSTQESLRAIRSLADPELAALPFEALEAKQAQSFKLARTANMLMAHLMERSMIQISFDPADFTHKWVSKALDCLKEVHQVMRALSPPASAGVSAFVKKTVQKFMVSFIKPALVLLKKLPEHFKAHMTGYLREHYQWLSTVSPYKCPKHSIALLMFYHEALSCSHYRDNPYRSDGATSILPPAVMRQLAMLLCTRYFPLTTADLKLWKTEPEDFVSLELHGTDDSPRLAAQLVFQCLVRSGGAEEHLISYLSKWFNEQTPLPEPSTLQAVVARDAFYTTLCLSMSTSLLRLFPLPRIIGMLVADVQRNDTPAMSILHRRAAYLISEAFFSSSIAKEVHHAQITTIFQLLIVLLRHADVVVRIWAAIALRGCIDQHEFDRNLVIPFAADIIALVTKLVFQLQYDIIHTQILSILSLLVSHLRELIAPFVFTIIDCLERLWAEAGSNPMLKSGVVQSLMALARIPELRSAKLYGTLVRVINQCVDVSIPEYIHYIEDGIDLWLELLSAMLTPASSPHLRLEAMSMTPVLLRCWQHVPRILREHFDFALIPHLMTISALYIGLDSAHYFESYADEPLRLCVSLFDDLQPKAVRGMLVVLHTYIQVFPADRLQAAIHPFISFLIRDVLRTPDECPKLYLDTLSVFSRILLRHGGQFFVQCLGGPEEAVPLLNVLLKGWVKTLRSGSVPLGDQLLIWLGLGCAFPLVGMPRLFADPSTKQQCLTAMLEVVLWFGKNLESLHDPDCNDPTHPILIAPLLRIERKPFLRANLNECLKAHNWGIDKLRQCCSEATTNLLKDLFVS